LPRHEKATEIRIVISFAQGFHAYQGALAAAIKILRPDAEVITVEPDKISEATKRFGPDVVITSRPEQANTEGVAAWVELSLDPSQASKVNLNGDRSEIANPTLDKLIGIIEKAAQLQQDETFGEHEPSTNTPPDRSRFAKPSRPAKDGSE
jgi:CMP-2-keto-3-deoxyoctulosonic acid synthetase